MNQKKVFITERDVSVLCERVDNVRDRLFYVIQYIWADAWTDEQKREIDKRITSVVNAVEKLQSFVE